MSKTCIHYQEKEELPTMGEALAIAKEHYDEKTYEHAIRVMSFVTKNNLIPKKLKEHCIILALFHDLKEDTKFNDSKLPNELKVSLDLLTKKKGEDYISYIKHLVDVANDLYNRDNLSGQCAYWVKLADMKDHLSQTETLTDRLRDKYLAALPYLL